LHDAARAHPQFVADLPQLQPVMVDAFQNTGFPPGERVDGVGQDTLVFPRPKRFVREAVSVDERLFLARCITPV
jgi:hypothetical protein